MSLSLTTRGPRNDDFNSGLVGAILLHLAIAAIIIAIAYVHLSNRDKWGDKLNTAGAIQASMVSALPLPPKAKPVDHQVLATDDPADAPKPPPKEATAPIPKPTDIPIKSNTKPPIKTAPVETPAPPKHTTPIPDTTKATTGSQTSQIAQSVTQQKNGTSSVTVQDHTFGDRYAYYIAIIQSVTSKNWNEASIDPRAAHNKSVSVLFDIQRDGTLTNIKLSKSSGVPSIDTAAVRAIQRIDGFGALPSGDHKTVEYEFDYN